MTPPVVKPKSKLPKSFEARSSSSFSCCTLLNARGRISSFLGDAAAAGASTSTAEPAAVALKM